ncbi:MAG: AI-2E family transporter [Wenzhouxiangella sp.]
MNEEQAARLPKLSREQVLWIMATLLFSGVLIWLLAPVLTPFLISALLAYMADPIVTRLERWMRRDMAVGVVFLLVFALLVLTLLLVMPVLIRETADLFSRLPAYFEQLQQRLQPLAEAYFGWDLDLAAVDAARLREVLEQNFSNLAAAGSAAWTYLSASGGRFVIWITGLFLVPLVTFYLMRDWHHLLEALRELLPRNIEPTVVRLTRDCDEALGGFLRGQLLVMLGQGTIYAVGLWLIGLNNGIAIGMIAGLISFVPYLGAIVGVSLALVTAIIQNFDPWFLLSVAVVFTVGQLVESFLLTPKLIGDRIGMHPVLVVFTVLAGGQLFGFIGVLLALPVAAAGTVLVRYFYRGYKQSRIYIEPSDEAGRAD